MSVIVRTPSMTRWPFAAGATAQGIQQLWSTGFLTSVQPIGPGILTVWARGTDCEGPPTMTVSVDGVDCGTVDVAEGWASYRFGCRPAPGKRRITVAYGNDRRTTDCDRNLYVDTITWEPAPPLSWAPPTLDRPVVLRVVPGLGEYRMDPARDYRVVLPPEPFERVGGLTLTGGRNVTLVGGEIRIPRVPVLAPEPDRRALLLQGQTGSVHVEGLHLTGDGLGEGIDLYQPHADAVTIENVRCEQLWTGPVDADVHSDVIQTWSGPRMLRVDRLTGITAYQGLMLGSRQTGPPMATADLRNVSLIGSYPDNVTPPQYLVNDDDPVPEMRLDNMWCGARGKLNAFTPAASPRAKLVNRGLPPVDLVLAGSVGCGYHTPGYAA